MIAISGGVLCAGNLVLDTLVRPVEAPQFGATIWVDSVEQHIGGNGANTSFALAKLGVPVRLLGAVGSDDFGARVLAVLENAGVDLSGVVRLDAPTPATVALVRKDGARALIHCPGASRTAFDPLPEIDRRGASHFHLANIFALPNLRQGGPVLLERARAAGMTTSVDTGWDARAEWIAALGPCFPFADVLFTNLDEARELTGTDDPRAAARFLQTRGVGDVVVKLGERGCAVFAGGSEIWAQAFRVHVVDTTGAGDSFAGGFLAGLYHGLNYGDAARLANAAGALSVSALGSIEGLQSYPETLSWLQSRT